MKSAGKEGFTIAILLLCLAGAPVFGTVYQAHHIRQEIATAEKRNKPTTGKVHVFQLTGIAKPGMWTSDRVAGWNYWWRRPHKFSDMNVNLGDTVVITLSSDDVTHAFTIPAIGVGPVDVDPGQVDTISFVANKAGSFPFMCAKVCSCTGMGFACTPTKKQGHEGMIGILTVTEPMGPANVNVGVTVSEDKGFQPSVIKVHQGDVIQLTVKSLSNGIPLEPGSSGGGVGFCISGYESKVDLQGIMAGESRSFKFKADQAGTFTIYSSTEAGPQIDNANGQFIVTAAPDKGKS
ncbi:MAG: hypothetical protein KGJ62_09065 [Armatimonadetes bacterium]|nr:hypothetical protein [Armatimonadota bacterium]MDE2206431.1 hypothetical protein [Armatimonadota bacterium]